MLTASDAGADAHLGADNEMFKPVDDGHFGDATVDISSLSEQTQLVDSSVQLHFL